MTLQPTADPMAEPPRLRWQKVGSREARKSTSGALLLATSPHTPTHPCPTWGLLPCTSRGTRLLPEGGGTGAEIPGHTEHTQALGKQHKGQQEPIQQ